MYIGQHDVSVALVERGETVWSAAAPITPDHNMSDRARIASALAPLLDRVPRSRWPVLRVDTALGPPWGRIKLVKGVPPVTRHGELVSMLRLNAGRFIASLRPIVITGASVVSSGEARVGLADRSAVDAVTHEILSRKLRIGRIVPMASLELADNSRNSTPGTNDVDEISARETVAARVAGSRGAMPLGLRPRDNPAAAVPDVSRRRIAIAGTGLAAAILIYIGGQVTVERVTLARSAVAVSGMAIVSDSGIREVTELRRIDRDLATAANFSLHRVSTALLLGAITQALPAGAAITTLRIDTASVDIVALSPRTAAVVDALSDVPNVVAPTIIGPISRETVGSRELERATIRLRIVPDYIRAKTRFEVERGDDR